jgi:hypothetical protein
MESITVEGLESVVGGASAEQAKVWAQTRTSAQPYCPITVARNRRMPRSRAQAVRVGEACLKEMGSFYAAFGRGRIYEGIDLAFPK